MSNFLSKIPLKIGVTNRNTFDLSCDSIGTTDFFRINPISVIPTVPGGKYNIKLQTFSRLAPLSQPMFGRCKVVNRAFFVPNRVIMHPWESFITDTPYSDDSSTDVIPTLVTTFTLRSLIVALAQSPFAYTTGATDTNLDFREYLTASDGSATYWFFTARGKRAYSLLRSLGYSPALANVQKNDVSYDVTYSALPLLAFYKIYRDWYANQAYVQSSYDGFFDGVNKVLTSTDLVNILSFVANAMYDKDYFTAAQDHPVVPNNGVSSAYSISDITNDASNPANAKSQVVSQTSPTGSFPSSPSIRNNNSSISYPGSITQFVLDQLKALTDFLHRNQLVGSKTADRLLVRFGLKPSDAALNQSIPFGHDEVPIQISDVMATATGNSQQGQVSLLGDYAGKGIGYGTGGFNYECDDYGYIIIVSSLIPKIGYVQGNKRYTTSYLNRLDFFTPEFDGKSGCQAIRVDELKSDYLTDDMSNYTSKGPSSVFGFIPRWADLKIGSDTMFGDFTIPTLSEGMSTWHLMRLFPLATQDSTLVHSESFTRGSQSDYDRVFAYTGSETDHFIMIYNLDIKASLPMAKLFDTYEFDGGREISMDINGTQFQ